MRFWQRLTSHHNCFHGSLWHGGHHRTTTLQRNMTTRDWKGEARALGDGHCLDVERREGGREGGREGRPICPLFPLSRDLPGEPSQERTSVGATRSAGREFPRLDGIRGKTHALFIPHLHNNMGKIRASGRGGGAGGGGMWPDHTSPTTCS